MNKQIATVVARNTTIMLVQQLATWASTFLLMLFLPRYLGPVNFGKLYLAISISTIFGMLVSYGGFQPVAKLVSRDPHDAPQIMIDAIGFRLLLAVVSIIAMLIFAWAVHYDNQEKVLILICGIGLLWQGVHTVLYGCFQGFERLQYTSIGSIAERIFVSLIGVSALLLGAGSLVVAIILTASTLVNSLLLVRFTPKIIAFLPRINWQGAMRQLKEGVPYFLFVVFGVIYYRIDTVMLSLYTSDTVVGWYGAAYRFFDVLNFLPSIYNIAIFPVLSRLWKTEDNTHARTAQKSMEFILLSGIPIAILVYAFAPNIIKLFYGLEGFQSSIIVLQMLCLGLLFLYVDMVLGTTLLASDRQKQLSFVAFCATPLNIGLNYLLIPYTQASMGNGGIGSALATALTELGVMLAAMAIMPRGIFKGFRYNIIVKGIASGGLMVGAIMFLSWLGVPWLAVAVVAPFVYGTAVISLRTLEANELSFFRGLLTVENIRKTFLPNRETV